MEKFNNILKNKYGGKIYAHTPQKDITKEKETLETHSQKALEYYEFILKSLDLEKVIIEMLRKIVKKEYVEDFLEVFKKIIYYHDMGKVNPCFQKEKMQNYITDNLKIKKLDSKHSLPGMILFNFLFLAKYLKHWGGEKDETHNNLFLVNFFSTTISRHHSTLVAITSIKDRIDTDLGEIKMIKNEYFNESEYLNLGDFKEHYNFYYIIKRFNEEQKEALFYLYKLFYSLLITSDYYATMEFLRGKQSVPEVSFLNNEIKNRINQEFYKEKVVGSKKYNFNKKLKDERYLSNLENSDIKDIEEIGSLRNKILIEAEKKLNQVLSSNPEKRVFYLNVPTGGGKTNISMKLALSILKIRREIKRVFYVFPFINIIEQNYKVIKDTLGLSSDEISPIYSTSNWQSQSEEESEELKYVLDNEFLNYPFVVMSNVNFFNSFIKSGKNANYKLHNLANSIVILDEIQSLNDKDWTLFNDFIKFSSENLNINYIVMSATLPKIDRISLKISSEEKSVYSIDLLDTPQEFYEHSKFKERVVFDYNPEINNQDKLIDELDIIIKEKSRILVVFNTVKDSSEIYLRLVKEKKYPDFKLFLLNSTILPSRRREIIRRLEDAKENKEKIILISTQSIEAGVDIDCDYGLRDLALFDSIEQVAGRINREGKSRGTLKIFNFKDTEKNVYKGSYRLEVMRKYGREEIKNFLNHRDFSLSGEGFYNKVINLINSENNDYFRKTSLDKVTKSVRGLDYESLNKEDVIDQESVSVFIGLCIPRTDFSEAELRFLEEIGVDTSKKTIDGNSFWKEYLKLSNFKNKTFVEKKIESKKIASVISKFTISINTHLEREIKEYLGEEVGGIYYLNPEYDIYSYEEGLKDPNLLEAII